MRGDNTPQHLLFGLDIDGGQRVVDDQQGPVAEQGPRQCQALPLPAGKFDPALADDRPVAVGKTDMISAWMAAALAAASISAMVASGRCQRRCWRRWCRQRPPAPDRHRRYKREYQPGPGG
jgi:hypothetical protein